MCARARLGRHMTENLLLILFVVNEKMFKAAHPHIFLKSITKIFTWDGVLVCVCVCDVNAVNPFRWNGKAGDRSALRWAHERTSENHRRDVRQTENKIFENVFFRSFDRSFVPLARALVSLNLCVFKLTIASGTFHFIWWAFIYCCQNERKPRKEWGWSRKRISIKLKYVLFLLLLLIVQANRQIKTKKLSRDRCSPTISQITR